MARPDAVQGTAFFCLDAWGFGLVFGEADPGRFTVGVGDVGDGSGVSGGGGQLLAVHPLSLLQPHVLGAHWRASGCQR